MLITVPGFNIHPAYNIDLLWSIFKCYVTLASIGLPDSARLAIQDITNDYDGENRKQILLTVMAAGGIRLRGHGDWVAIEFMVDTSQALLACRDVLRNIAGDFTMCVFNSLGAGETLHLYYGEYEQHIDSDIEEILRLAEPLPPQGGA